MWGLWRCLPSSACISGTNCRSTQAVEPAAKAGWSLATALVPGFRRQSARSAGKNRGLRNLPAPEGGRKDIFHWAAPGEKPVAELEIYRPGGEFDPIRAAHRRYRRPDGGSAQRPAVNWKLLASSTANSAPSRCFAIPARRMRQSPALASSNTSMIRRCKSPAGRCQGDTLPARRAAIGCMLDRLTLLTSGNEPKLAELFARAELKRSGCGLPHDRAGGLGDGRGKSAAARPA